jgi:hypothetical protein
MPSASKTIGLDRLYSQEEFDRIAAGCIPGKMEDKWFIFYEDSWLYLHRSWTGFCIFKVRFESGAEGMKVIEVHVNQDPAQHTEVDDRRNATRLGILLDSRASRDVRSQMIDYIKGQSGKPE